MSEMRITHEQVGVYDFPQEKIPLLSRRITSQRFTEQGGGHQRIDFTLSGFVEGSNHAAIMLFYQQLAPYLNGHRVRLYYHDGTRVILDTLVHIDGFTDPEQWKQRLGDYQITGYYFEEMAESYKGVVVSYASAAGSYQFKQVPSIAIRRARDRDAPNAHEFLPSGASIGTTVTMQLSGEICAPDHSNLINEKSLVDTAFSRDGTLSYGVMSFAVHSAGPQWGPIAPLNYWPFTIDLTYFLTGLLNFSCEIDFDRISYDPLIYEQPHCGTSFVVTRFSTGQHVNYHFQASGVDIPTIRTLLLNEILAVIVPGGYEKKGGRERRNINSPNVSVTIPVFYPVPVFSNLGGVVLP